MLFVFWWDIAGLPNTQLIIPLIIHNVENYSDENKSIPTTCSRIFLSLLSLTFFFCSFPYFYNTMKVCFSFQERSFTLSLLLHANIILCVLLIILQILVIKIANMRRKLIYVLIKYVNGPLLLLLFVYTLQGGNGFKLQHVIVQLLAHQIRQFVFNLVANQHTRQIKVFYFDRDWWTLECTRLCVCVYWECKIAKSSCRLNTVFPKIPPEFLARTMPTARVDGRATKMCRFSVTRSWVALC